MTNLHAYFDKPTILIDNAAKVALVLSIFFTPLGTAPANVFLVITVFLWLVAGGYKQRFKDLQKNYFAWSTLALYFLICIGGVYSSAESSEIKFQLVKYAKLLIILIGISLFKEKKWRDVGLNAFAISMLITLLLSLGSVFLTLPFIKGGDGNHYVFKDHIVQNLMMSFFVLLMLIKSRGEVKKSMQIAYFSVAVFAAIDIIFFVQGRTGYVSLGLNIAIFVLFFISTRDRWIWIASIIFVISSGLYFSDNFSGRLQLAVTEFQNQDSKELTSVGQRVEFFKKSVELIKERPVFGWGTGSYAKEFCRVAISPEWCQAGKFHPHNQFLAFGVQLGLFGVFCYFIFLGAAVQLARQFYLPEKVLLIGLVGTLIVDSLLHAPLFLVTEAQFFILMLGLLTAGNKISGNNILIIKNKLRIHP